MQQREQITNNDNNFIKTNSFCIYTFSNCNAIVTISVMQFKTTSGDINYNNWLLYRQFEQ